jgi:Zn-dependent metalloprotease/PKD repeat protein
VFVLAALFATSSFGQNKSLPTLPNLPNPFNNGAGKNIVMTAAPQQRTAVAEKTEIKIETDNGGVFHHNLSKYSINRESLTEKFNFWLELSDKYSFQEISERTDELGFTHVSYQQLYKSIPIDGCVVMVHYKNGVANSINGQVSQKENIPTQQAISSERAYTVAKEHLKVSELINEYPVELLIATIPSENGYDYKLAYKVRIDAANPFTMCYVFIDAQTGNVINKINLIAHADTPGTAVTLYSGTQNITCDSYSGSYRLRENGRKIETYNATNATFSQGVGFSNYADYTTSSTTWQAAPRLNSFTISNVSTSWWYTSFADEQPDLYIKVKNGSNQTVYTSSYFNNTFPSVTFSNLNTYLTSPPYTVEVWDYDAVGGDDFGGSYTINTSTGTFNWSGNGNNGSYNVIASGHPALDVHWGMEKTYDFYSTVFSRNSYDGNGSTIRNFFNSPLTQANQGGDPNNAFALPAPYNCMAYGAGDGSLMNPVVGLDVEGHEYSHLVINNNGNGGLTYQGESGALNESFADIFGTCIEFYSNVNPDWTIGEGLMIPAPFMRSMSNPKSSSLVFSYQGNSIDMRQPNTYQGQYWKSTTNLADDNGGVHRNSGVQNYWFYLLSQGGSGTNDLGNSYSVTGIGINQARQIAYRNLTTYLGSNSNYWAAYNGSLQAAEDLYGNPSTQYNAVRAAWYAVGIGTNPNTYCGGTTVLTSNSGTVTDGSGSANYNNNSNCKWVIAPPGATQITINFTYFNLEVGYDTVFVYGGTDTLGTPLTYTGTSLPPQIQTPAGVGACLIKFKTDASVTAGGWSFNYNTTGITPTCSGLTTLTTPTGSFTDGSGSSNYGNNQNCFWYIAPPCATSVTLSFSQFNTELNYDGIIVYDDINGTNQLAVFTGTTIPASITSNTGTMLVRFISDFVTTAQGFTANYTSTGSAYCSGTTTLNSADWGTFTDGSGTNNYCNNMDCRWLIQPPQATSVTLTFNSFDLELPDGQTIFDAVEVYNGTTIAAPLLGRFAGTNLPNAVTSTGGSMLVRFYSDLLVTRQGFSATYTSTTNPYCNGQTTLTAPSGSFSDGSGTNQYANNSQCSWLIQPPNATSITLSFIAFSTEQNNDGVIVYDGANNSAPILGQFSGTNLPSAVTSTGGSMFVEFISGTTVRADGWTANYTSTIPPSAPVANFSATNTNFCEGTCINFTDNSTNTPTSWSWSFPGGNPSSSTAQNPSNICYNSAGTYSVILTSSNSGGSNTKTTNGYITVNPQPITPTVTANPSNVVCQGQSVTLSVSNPCAGCIYNWSPNGQTGTSIPVTASNLYSAIASNNCGQATSNSVNITVNQLPPIPTITTNGNQLTSSSPNGNQWFLNNSILSGENSQILIAQQSGVYHVVVTDANNCSSQSSTVTFTITGIKQLSAVSDIAVFPNPTSGIVYLNFSNSYEKLTIHLIDVSGRQLLEREIRGIYPPNSYTLVLDELPSGIYQLRISNDEFSVNHKIVLTK